MTGWLRSQVFRYVHGNHLVYNTCWEDPRIDRSALDLTPKDDLLVITSAGCNALDYLLAGAASVTAVDINPRQNALLELKIAAARTLSYEHFFEIFGRGEFSDFDRAYVRQLRPQLSRSAQVFWDRRTRYFAVDPHRASGFYFHGSAGIFARMVNFYIDHIAKIRDQVTELLATPTFDEQRELYHESVRGRFWSRKLKWLMGRDATLALLGVPPTQRIQLENAYQGGIVAFIQECLDAVFGGLPLHDNYFYRVYLTGAYTSSCCPEYLRRENFDLLRERLDRITVYHGSILDLLEHHERAFSRFVLLDHMDWLSVARPDLLAREWDAIIRRSAPNTRIIWRSGNVEVDYVDPLPVTVQGRRARLGDLLSYDRAKAAKLHPFDRVHTYGSFFIADLAAA